MYAEIATMFRWIYFASVASSVFLGLALGLMFYTAWTEPVKSATVMVVVFSFFGLGITASIASFCHDILKGMRKKGLIL